MVIKLSFPPPDIANKGSILDKPLPPPLPEAISRAAIADEAPDAGLAPGYCAVTNDTAQMTIKQKNTIFFIAFDLNETAKKQQRN